MNIKDISNLVERYTSPLYPGIWYGMGCNEFINEFNNYKYEPMLEDLKSMLGQIPAIEGRVKKLEDKKPLEDYVECEECGVLVRKEKAQVLACLDTEYEKKQYSNMFSRFMLFGVPEAKAQEIYLCQHCSMKEFKKKNKIK